MLIGNLCRFIQAREAVRIHKEAGEPRPWTKDKILDTYRFCNVHREDDAVTKWIAQHWRRMWARQEDLWFAMVVARLFNLPKTLEYLTPYVLIGELDVVRDVLCELRKRGPIFNGAYIVSTNGVAMDKVDYLIDRVLTPLWKVREILRPKQTYTLAWYHHLLMKYDGLGSFLAAQVVADLKYVEPLKSAKDWHTFAAPGPGSRRGLNRVCGRPTEAPWPGQTWQYQLGVLQTAVNARLRGTNIHLHAQDLQNCLCEFDKYERVRLGEGKPKQLYREKSQ